MKNDRVVDYLFWQYSKITNFQIWTVCPIAIASLLAKFMSNEEVSQFSSKLCALA